MSRLILEHNLNLKMDKHMTRFSYQKYSIFMITIILIDFLDRPKIYQILRGFCCVFTDNFSSTIR